MQNFLFARNEVGRLSKIEFELQQSLCNFLEPLNKCIESIKGSKYVTIHASHNEIYPASASWY